MKRRNFFGKLAAGTMGAFLPIKSKAEEEKYEWKEITMQVEMRPRDFGWTNYICVLFHDMEVDRFPQDSNELFSGKYQHSLGIDTVKIDLEDNWIYNERSLHYEIEYSDKTSPSIYEAAFGEIVNSAFIQNRYILVCDSKVGRQFMQWCMDHKYEFLLVWDPVEAAFKTIKASDEEPSGIYITSNLGEDNLAHFIPELSQPLKSCLVWLEQNVRRHD